MTGTGPPVLTVSSRTERIRRPELAAMLMLNRGQTK